MAADPFIDKKDAYMFNLISQIPATDKFDKMFQGSSAAFKGLELLNNFGIENPLCGTCRSLITSVDNVLMNKTIEFAVEAALSYVCGF